MADSQTSESKDKILIKIAAILLLMTVLAWNFLPAKELEGYFDFADQRGFFGIPNFFDVVSNFAFLYAGVLVFSWVKKSQAQLDREYQVIGFYTAISMSAVAFCSSYFHWSPGEERVFWDRVPMVYAFVGVWSLVVSDRVNLQLGVRFLKIGAVLATLFLATWYMGYMNLRPYIVVQFGGMVFVLLLSLLRKNGRIPNSLIWQCLGLYGLAKAFEMSDSQVFAITGIVSGHTIKHLVAALAILRLMSFYHFKTTDKN